MEEAKEKLSLKQYVKIFFTHCKQYPLKQILSAAYLPAALIYLEVLFRIVSVQEPFTGIGILSLIFASLAGGLILDVLSSITKNEKLNFWIAFILLQLIAAAFMLIHFVKLEFSIYIGPQSIAGGANGITQHAGNYITEIIARNWPTILLFEVPVLIFLVLYICKLLVFRRYKALGYIQLLLVIALFEAAAAVPLCNMSPSWELLTSEFDYDSAVHSFNAQTATKLDVLYSIFSNPWKQNFSYDKKHIPEIDDPENYNMLQLDFNELLDESTNIYISRIHEYVRSLEPTKKNQYTGLFKGMNLIEITAESYTPYILDEELTPTLCKLVNNGIVFDDYYQPLWAGSTTTGEFQILTGLLPSNGFYSMLRTSENNMYFTVGNMMLREDYTSLAFHNGTYDYFDRNLTHCNLGYTRFYANGSGMIGLSGHLAWPQSDVEMMEFSIPKFVDKEPFNAYFMTLSGHSKYDKKNFVVRKNIDEVREWAEKNGKDYTDAVLSYFAANLEFEKSLKYLLDELEKAGVLDNTVIVMTGDHYPYSLSDDYVIDDTNHVKYFGVEENLINLFGFDPETEQDYSHNSLVIWTPSLDGDKSIHVSEPVCSVDILPTISNLFGLPYDSRMLAGRDVFAENSQPLVIFLNYNWLTDRGYYNAETRVYTPNEGMSYDGAGDPEFASDKEYMEYINTIVKNKMIFSQNVPNYDYYNVIFGPKE
ncbi:MAG: sulfatase-like hydrolase/transferase [Parasporobacterium sp.]|nr:sulfatase-like hydrolase/transferase [Parasporobacterium sp.]